MEEEKNGSAECIPLLDRALGTSHNFGTIIRSLM